VSQAETPGTPAVDVVASASVYKARPGRVRAIFNLESVGASQSAGQKDDAHLAPSPVTSYGDLSAL
jgi:hypothetical protein